MCSIYLTTTDFGDLHVGVMLQGQRAATLHCNQAALDLLSLTEDQLLGRTSLDPSWIVIRKIATAAWQPE